MSVFDEPGWYIRHPQSGVESVNWKELKAAGFATVALNYRDFPQSTQWATITNRASAAGIGVIPWAHCFTTEEVTKLCNQARKMPDRAVIVNAERELVDGSIPCGFIREQVAGLDACVSTLSWLGDRDVSELGPDVALHLQLFPQENDSSTRPRDCRAHAFIRGARRVNFMLGMHDIHSDSFPPRQEPYWVYTLDDCIHSWKEWTPQTIPPLTIPHTGPYYGPSSPKYGTRPKKSKTAKALKIILTEAGFANFPSNPDLFYNVPLEQAMRRLQLWAGIRPLSGAYGKAAYEAIRRLASARVGGTYACTPTAEKLIREDAAS